MLGIAVLLTESRGESAFTEATSAIGKGKLKHITSAFMVWKSKERKGSLDTDNVT
jgi:hypothetical protein